MLWIQVVMNAIRYHKYQVAFLTLGLVKRKIHAWLTRLEKATEVSQIGLSSIQVRAKSTTTISGVDGVLSVSISDIGNNT